MSARRFACSYSEDLWYHLVVEFGPTNAARRFADLDEIFEQLKLTDAQVKDAYMVLKRAASEFANETFWRRLRERDSRVKRLKAQLVSFKKWYQRVHASPRPAEVQRGDVEHDTEFIVEFVSKVDALLTFIEEDPFLSPERVPARARRRSGQPINRQATYALRLLLNQHGYQNVEVAESKVPYRD
jgi:hypothetical protein